MEQFKRDYAAQYAQQERDKMAVRWTTKSREVHTSKAIWIGEKPKDGGVSLLLEALQWARDNKQAGRMTLNLGTGGSISDLEFEQSEFVPSPVAEFDTES
jgi:hypothetical protein